MFKKKGGKGKKMIGAQRFMEGEGKHSFNIQNKFQKKESKHGKRNKRGHAKKG